jgi:hypothetical protein
MKRRTIAAAAAVLALAACGNATDNTTFSPPANFHSAASIGPFMQIWESGPRSVLMLMAMPFKTKIDEAMSQAQIKGSADMKTSKVAICDGKQQAIFASGEGQTSTTSSDKTPSEIELIVTEINGKTYMAMYGRPLHAPADAAAEAAIRNVCPK